MSDLNIEGREYLINQALNAKTLPDIERMGKQDAARFGGVGIRRIRQHSLELRHIGGDALRHETHLGAICRRHAAGNDAFQ